MISTLGYEYLLERASCPCFRNISNHRMEREGWLIAPKVPSGQLCTNVWLHLLRPNPALPNGDDAAPVSEGIITVRYHGVKQFKIYSVTEGWLRPSWKRDRRGRAGWNEVTETLSLTRRYISFNNTKRPSRALTSSEIAEKPNVRESFEGDKKRFLSCE
jgi:hypothetical protein